MACLWPHEVTHWLAYFNLVHDDGEGREEDLPVLTPGAAHDWVLLRNAAVESRKGRDGR